MTKPRVFIVHRWEGSPESDWYPWLRGELVKQGIDVHVPEMPHPEAPQIDTWMKTLKGAVHGADAQTFFVGHSIGGQTILRYLETIPDDIQIGGLLLIATWLTLKPVAIEDESAKMITDPWLHRPIHWTTITKHVPRAAIITSDNDPFGPMEDQHMFHRHLKAPITIERGGGHISGDDGMTQLPSALRILQDWIHSM